MTLKWTIMHIHVDYIICITLCIYTFDASCAHAYVDAQKIHTSMHGVRQFDLIDSSTFDFCEVYFISPTPLLSWSQQNEIPEVFFLGTHFWGHALCDIPKRIVSARIMSLRAREVPQRRELPRELGRTRQGKTVLVFFMFEVGSLDVAQLRPRRFGMDCACMHELFKHECGYIKEEPYNTLGWLYQTLCNAWESVGEPLCAANPPCHLLAVQVVSRTTGKLLDQLASEGGTFVPIGSMLARQMATVWKDRCQTPSHQRMVAEAKQVIMGDSGWQWLIMGQSGW